MGTTARIKVCFLGGVAVIADGEPQSLPRSRKTRGLLAYLVLNPKSLRRELLCSLFWEDNSDPRAALRWARSKLRPLLGDALLVEGSLVALDRSQLRTDIDQVQAAVASAKSLRDLALLVALEARFDESCLGDLDCTASPVYHMWLESEPSQLRQLHCELLRGIANHSALNEQQREEYVQRWLAHDPCSVDAPSLLLPSHVDRFGLPAAQRVFESLSGNWHRQSKDNNELLLCWRGLSNSAISIKHQHQAGRRRRPQIRWFNRL